MRILNGITHATVTTPSKLEAGLNLYSAIVDIHFGNKGIISGIKYTKSGWTVPIYDIIKEDKAIEVPVFTGTLQVELSQLASKALARVKEQFGSANWNTKYLVFQDRVEIVPKEEENNVKS